MRQNERRGPLESGRFAPRHHGPSVLGTVLAILLPFAGIGFLFGLVIFFVIMASGGSLGFLACWGLGCIFTFGLWGITR